jgi:DNA-binding NtrC family response regulator
MTSTAPNAPGQPTRILVIDADRRVRNSLESLIEVADGLACVCSVADPADALSVLESQPVDCVLIDPRLPELEVGLAFLAEARRRWPDLALVAMSGSEDVAPASLRNGAMSFVAKSGHPEELLAALSRKRRRAGTL